MNKISVQFALLFIISYTAIMVLYAFSIITSTFLQSAVYAGILNLINVVLSVYAFNKGYRNSNKNFILFIFGGMIIRMFLILLLFFIFIKYFHLQIMLFVFAFLVLYFISLILEINYYRLTSLRKKA